MQKEVPELWGHRLHDEAGYLTNYRRHAGAQSSRVFEDSTSNQMAILIVNTLDGENIEQFGIRVADKWKLGTKDRDNRIPTFICNKMIARPASKLGRASKVHYLTSFATRSSAMRLLQTSDETTMMPA